MTMENSCGDRSNALIAARLRETADPTRAARMGTAMRGLAEDLGRLIALCKEACELTAREGRVADRRRKQVSEEIAALCRTRDFFSTLVQRATRTIVKKGGVAYQSVSEIAQAERALYAAIGTLASSLHPQVVAAAERLGATTA